MSFWSSIGSFLQSLFAKVPASAVATIDGQTVTWGDLESSAGTIGTFWANMAAAAKAKNHEAEVEVGIEGVAGLINDLGIAEPESGIIAKLLLPGVFALINNPGVLKKLMPQPIPAVTTATETMIEQRFDPTQDAPKLEGQP